MAYQVRYTKAAREDLHRLFTFLLEKDIQAARRARDAIVKAAEFLQNFPFSCRKADTDNPFLRELLIPFGSDGYVALFEIEDRTTDTILAIRHQREDDYL
ncbi:MAG: type II toxin-antitoxin system RelE/ParE family toxin [Thiobacillus sp.]|nr:type II toxin-antitoxin system RelE/ParE family toxin [Thiobacillus sp.]MDP2057922.1 type II toxin-antitoxin system RelE/ParE family toxin [Thiobacillus sp.]